MARWITIIPAAVPFDYRWPDRTALTAFTAPGEYLVKDEVADYAVGRGFATEGKAKGSTTRSTKGGTRRRRSSKPRADATAANHRRAAPVGRPDVPDDGGAADGPAMGPGAG